LGVDGDRIFLAGHLSGGQLAALVALNPIYLAKHGLGSELLAGVIPISAIFDLTATHELPEEFIDIIERAFPSPALRRSASPSPSRRLFEDQPPVVVLAAQQDVPGLRKAAIAFSAQLREAGHPEAETFVAPGRNHRSVLEMGAKSNAARHHLLALLGVDKSSGNFRDTLAARNYWRNPDLSTEDFWQDSRLEKLVQHYESDERLATWLQGFLSSGGGRSASFAAPRYDAVDLLALLEALGTEKVGRGRWLTLTNARHERAVLDLDALRDYEPRVVVGMEGERNLFRITDVYHTKRRYTWLEADAEVWIMARPVGAFLHFNKSPPKELIPGSFGLFGLTLESFQLSEADPLGALRADLSQEEQNFLIRDKACVSCHQFRGVGTKAGHLRARDGKLVGGFALSLEEYPPETWRRYCFEQREVAAEIGASEIRLSPQWQERLFKLVAGERAADR
jgi:hypothetical protein